MLRYERNDSRATERDPAEIGSASVTKPKAFFCQKLWEEPESVRISPLLANIYLHGFEVRFQRPDGPGGWANAKIVRYADDFVVLARYDRRWDRPNATAVAALDTLDRNGQGRQFWPNACTVAT